jgi:fatty-acyl-CoA synthase
MHHTMMPYELTLTSIFERARTLYGKTEVVTRLPDKSLHRYTYADFDRRARKLSAALRAAGMKKGDRVATLMWNHYAHLEAYFAIPIGGGVLHTLNLRLHPDEIGFIATHAGDSILVIDDVLYPLYAKFKDRCPAKLTIVVPLTGQPVPEGTVDYEEFLRGGDEAAPLADVREEDPMGMCYTSGTTGKSKGVVYSHRSIALHSLAAALTDTLAISRKDTILPVVPMFHVNAWGIPFAAVMVGAKLVMPGPHLDAVSLLDLFEAERVTVAAGVPTIGMGILEALDESAAEGKPRRLTSGLRMVVGGSAAPESMIRAFDRHGLRVIHAWGMTETAPLGTVAQLSPEILARSEDEQYAARAKQGVPTPFVEVRAVNDDGLVPRDGRTSGELEVRGAWVAASYYDMPAESARWTDDGWFKTGDVVTIDGDGFVKITDRTKDLIKSGGEWISSVDVENALMGHPSVKEACVVAVFHPKWDERPVAAIVLKDGMGATPDELRAFLAPKFTKICLPDAFVFMDAIPRTSAGKFLKRELRERFKNQPPT